MIRFRKIAEYFTNKIYLIDPNLTRVKNLINLEPSKLYWPILLGCVFSGFGFNLRFRFQNCKN